MGRGNQDIALMGNSKRLMIRSLVLEDSVFHHVFSKNLRSSGSLGPMMVLSYRGEYRSSPLFVAVPWDMTPIQACSAMVNVAE